MGNMDKGWILLSRSIKEHWLWSERPVSKFQAWIDLLLSVNYYDNDILFDGSKITIKRGSMVTSVRKLSMRWGWSKDKTLKFLRELETDEMITRIADARKTTLTIVNYDKYQNMRDSHKDTKRTLTGRRPDTDSPQIKESKRSKKKIKEIPLPSEEILYGIPDDEIEWEDEEE